MTGIFVALCIIFALGALVSVIVLTATQEAPWAWLACIFAVLMIFCHISIGYLEEPSAEKCECNCACCETKEKK